MVQPVLLDFGDASFDIAGIGEETGVNNALRVLARRGSFPLVIHFLEPFDPAALAGRKAVTVEVRGRIAAALSATTGHPIA